MFEFDVALDDLDLLYEYFAGLRNVLIIVERILKMAQLEIVVILMGVCNTLTAD